MLNKSIISIIILLIHLLPPLHVNASGEVLEGASNDFECLLAELSRLRNTNSSEIAIRLAQSVEPISVTFPFEK